MAAAEVPEQQPAEQVDPQQAPARRIFRSVYGIQFSHTELPGRQKPSNFDRKGFAELLISKHEEMFLHQHRGSAEPNRVMKVMVFRELHSNGQPNYYAAIAALRCYGFSTVKRALEIVGVYVSCSCTHTMYWSLVVYGAVPSQHKRLEEIDKYPYHSRGLTSIQELEDIPDGARKAEKERVRAFLGLPVVARGRSSSAVVGGGFGKEQLAELIREHGWRSRGEVTTGVRNLRATNSDPYRFLLQFGAKNTDDFVDWVWELEDGPAMEIDRMQKLQEHATSTPCVCNGAWRPAAQWLLQYQVLDSILFRQAILKALTLGRRKRVNVLIHGEPDAGKSFLLRPLIQMYKTFIRRGQHENYPLQGLLGAEICVLQDVRYETFGLPWDDWLAWGDNEELTIKLPRTHFKSSLAYKGTAPLFASMGDLMSYPPGEALRTGRRVDRENAQMRSRWHHVPFRAILLDDL